MSAHVLLQLFIGMVKGKNNNNQWRVVHWEIFCFVSKPIPSLQIKAECPLCKQGFKSIIHNVKSMDKYEEYKVDNYRTNWASIANQFEQFLLATSFPPFR